MNNDEQKNVNCIYTHPTGNSPIPPNIKTTPLTQVPMVSTGQITYNHITYALAIFSYFTAGLTWIIPIVMNYLKRNEARGTWLYSHYDWQIKTFWYSIFFGAIAVAMITIGFSSALLGVVIESNGLAGGSGVIGVLGFMLLGIVICWHLYRIVRGWIALTNRRAVL